MATGRIDRQGTLDGVREACGIAQPKYGARRTLLDQVGTAADRPETTAGSPQAIASFTTSPQVSTEGETIKSAAA